ncbi:MAG: ParB N-terminal domain-containing protein [Alphaproteobacteria bacterium]|nr:DNA methylase N-4 [Rhizobiaceae bacterium]MBU3962067.1 ParB N-terminal domain-containing protein [Alphaproteobacteria bacterium]MBU4048136.1 ParB N-terminal domain-containing protein [Alphaproteobacteria bacterium]MBU4091372.1 ParB N-terminal domain-containing protein [Alphaproteobacteria bacterium]MBU4159071.1 ParB N-terminal domain-containing protein [Alphaproteobacteria bacterium]
MHPPNEQSCPIDILIPYASNARTHSKKQIGQIAESIKRFGFCNPVLISKDNTIIAGHGRVQAAKQLGMTEVPVRMLSHLSRDEVRAYILADNKLAENAGWDRDILAIEMQGLIDLDFDIELLGFSTTEIDFTIDGEQRSSSAADEALDAVEPISLGPAVSRLGDLWQLGPHRLLCGDARSHADVARLCEGGTAALLFTDPPYNVPIAGHVSGLGRMKHREFAVASGEMDETAFTGFLRDSLGAAANHLTDGAIAFVCMDWRHIGELLAAGRAVFEELKNLCVWNKTNGGMGSFYRSKHELVFVFKKGGAPHINNFGLGDTGRYRTNVWDYPGISSLGAARDEELAMHPTVKPVALIADAIRDCSRRGDIVLDVFGGSGSTLIAAEQCGRVARLIELDPLYCDTIIRRFERVTGEPARLEASGSKFSQVNAERLNGKDGVSADVKATASKKRNSRKGAN